MPLKHGHAVNGKQSRTYMTWTAMLARCENSKDSRFRDYGGRGITVCLRWHKFENFLADMGERPAGKTIGRRDNNGQYCKDNCRWETPMQQSANSRRVRRQVFNGLDLHLAEWARRFGLNRATLYGRIRRWGIEKAFQRSAPK
jgi:hypothetical protein